MECDLSIYWVIIDCMNFILLIRRKKNDLIHRAIYCVWHNDVFYVRASVCAYGYFAIFLCKSSIVRDRERKRNEEAGDLTSSMLLIWFIHLISVMVVFLFLFSFCLFTLHFISYWTPFEWKFESPSFIYSQEIIIYSNHDQLVIWHFTHVSIAGCVTVCVICQVVSYRAVSCHAVSLWIISISLYHSRKFSKYRYIHDSNIVIIYLRY